MILIKHYGCALERFKRVAVLDKACHHHCVDDVACREYERKARIHVALIIVCDCIRQVEGVCLVRVEVALEVYYYTFSLDLELRRFLQRR